MKVLSKRGSIHRYSHSRTPTPISRSTIATVHRANTQIRTQRRFVSDPKDSKKSAASKSNAGTTEKQNLSNKLSDLYTKKPAPKLEASEEETLPNPEEEEIFDEKDSTARWLEQIQSQSAQNEGLRFAGGQGEVLMDKPLLWEPLPPPPPTLYNIQRVTDEEITSALKYRRDWEFQLFRHFYEQPLRDSYASVLKKRIEEAAKEKKLQRKQYIKRAKRDALKKIKAADLAEMQELENLDIERDSKVDRVTIGDIYDTVANTDWNEELTRYDTVDAPAYIASRRGWDEFVKQQDSDDATLLVTIHNELKQFGFETIPLEEVIPKIPTRTKKTRLSKQYPFMLINKQWASESHHAWNIDFLQRKVKLKVKVKALRLSEAAKERLLSIVGLRYNKKNDILSLVADVHPHQSWNKNYVRRLLQALLSEAWKADELYVPPEGIPPPNKKLDFSPATNPDTLLSLYHIPLDGQ